jgi:hypothetical protein
LLETLWAILVSNVALLINITVTVLSLIFGGGTALLNIVLEAVSDNTMDVYFAFLSFVLESCTLNSRH